MNSESIYDAITNIREDSIDEAREHKLTRQRKPAARWYALAASLLLVFGTASYVLLNLSIDNPIGPASGGGGRQEGSTVFMSYAGPVFPLSVLGDSTGITTSRDITFDFSNSWASWQDESDPASYYGDIRVTDSYTIVNNTGNDKTVRVLYPFDGNFSEFYRLQPALSVNGNALEAEVLAGPYSGRFTGTGSGDDHLSINLKQVGTWEDYVALLSDGEYLKRTLEASRVLDQTVTVYEFSNTWANHDAAVNPTLAASFNLDYDRTTMLSYGFHGASWDTEAGFMRQSFSVPEEWSPRSGISFYLIAVGDDIYNLNVQGYINGGCYDGDEMSEVSADMTRYEAVLGDLLVLLLDDFMDTLSGYYVGDPQAAFDSIDMALFYRAVVEHLCEFGVLSENVAQRYETGWLEELFSEALGVKRVFYLTAEVEVPAYGSLELRAEMIKPGSFDFYGTGSSNMGVYGYDMVTALGSNLEFNSITANITGAELITIVRQNFGFDIENGIVNVTLNPEVPHYYLEVLKATSNE
jgi:hypothetical protein